MSDAAHRRIVVRGHGRGGRRRARTHSSRDPAQGRACPRSCSSRLPRSHPFRIPREPDHGVHESRHARNLTPTKLRRTFMAVTSTFNSEPAERHRRCARQQRRQSAAMRPARILVNGGAVADRSAARRRSPTPLIQAFGLGGNDVITLNEANGALPAARTCSAAPATTCSPAARATTSSSARPATTRCSARAAPTCCSAATGNDTLTGGDADDQMFGEAGDDRMIWNPGDDTDLHRRRRRHRHRRGQRRQRRRAVHRHRQRHARALRPRRPRRRSRSTSAPPRTSCST